MSEDKKNCLNCEGLQWYSADYEEFCDSGWYCNLRLDETVMDKMRLESYLTKAKSCCILRKTKQDKPNQSIRDENRGEDDE